MVRTPAAVQRGEGAHRRRQSRGQITSQPSDENGHAHADASAQAAGPPAWSGAQDEAAITNTGVIQPAEGFHGALRQLASDSGTLLVIDETHTLASGPGGLTRHWELEPDVVVVGKSIASGIPLGAYGMSDAVAGVLEHDPSAAFGDDVATGGTLFGNALSLAAARVTLEEVLTNHAYEHAAALGGQLADGIEAVVATHGLQ